MTKITPSFIFCGALLYFTLEVQGSNVKNFTAQWTSDYMYTPEIVNINGQLLAIGLQNNTINITSTFGILESSTCKISLKPGEAANDKIRAVALGNGKVIVHTSVWVEKKMPNFNLSDAVWDLFIIFKPHNCCSLKTVEVHHGWDRDWVALVPYQSSFDLFYYKKPNNKTDTLLAPQRFDDQGDHVKLDYFLGFESQISGLKIQAIKPYDASKGYVSFMNSMIKYHNSRFETINEIDITNPVNTMSGVHGRASYCYIKYPPKSTSTLGKKRFDFVNDESTKKEEKEYVVCELFDNDLKIKGRVKLHKLENKHAYEVTVNNLSDGGAVVAIAHRGPRGSKGHPMEFYVQRINTDGSLRDPIQVSEHSIFYHQMSLIPKQDKEFCLVDGGEVETFKAFTNLKNSMWINCIDISSL